jgi:hypothetical protein
MNNYQRAIRDITLPHESQSRLGPEGTRVLKRSNALRVWSSLGFVFLPLVVLATLALFRTPATSLVVAAAAYILVGVPTLIVLLVAAARSAGRAARAAGSYLDTRYAHVDAIPKNLLRMPVEATSSLRFEAKWTGVIVGGTIALIGVLFALSFVAVQIASLASNRPAGSSSVLLIVLCVCCFAVGLPVMYWATRKIAGQRAQWFEDHEPASRSEGE